MCDTSCNAHRNEETSAFTANYVEGSGKPLIFSRVELNVGNDYNTSTGVFTCRVPGIYYFMVSLEKQRDATHDYVVAIMLIKGTNTLYSHVWVNDAGYHMLGVSGTFHMKRGDTASISSSPASYFRYDGGAFTGFLIRPDYV
ncbi:complement C1q tumor necrosis factor-related protein 4-like [Dreissena polymorpha]|uniref:complement C1q tumor necrosis factor-related protein 4-like n=1 Tax=Dreissena polymorpha TaxID=45954 RepID=UPI00226470E9|nr:complement C1q tumor necrosis factor-related protein 4-like [Dreissena polymorpha]